MGNLIVQRSHSVLLVVLILTLASAGCGKIESIKRGNDFKKALDSYGFMIRWGKYEQAEAFINMRAGVPKLPDMQYLKELHVTRYDVTEQVPFGENNDDPKQVAVVAVIEYYHDSTLRVKSIRHQQLWWYDDLTGKWFLDGDLPDFSQSSSE